MEPLPAKLSEIGNSVSLIVPSKVGAFLGFKAGLAVKCRIIEGGTEFEARLRAFKHSIGIIVPRDILDADGLALGDTVEVPFGEWHVVKTPSTSAKRRR